MENIATQPPVETTTTPQQTHPPVAKKDHGFFTWFGKMSLVLFFGLALLGGGYYFGIKNNTMVAPSPTPTTTAVTNPTETLPSPTPASQNTKTVKAGLAGDATAFKPYNIELPSGWTDARETTLAVGIDKLTLTKNGYSVTIYQAPMGGGGCIYKGDAPNEMAQLYTDFADINGKSGQYRRSWTQNAGQSITYTICQKSESGSYNNMTIFGSINVVSPNPANTTILNEIDGMIASLIKQ